ncbi:MAG: helix-turn-helix transcriptional regulator [Rikenellaceae bacterium]
MKEKIVQLMKSEGLTSSRLAEILEIQPSGISHIVSGRNKPGFDLLQKILRRFPQINPDWLLLDSPTMYRADDDAGATHLSLPASDSIPIDLFDLPGSDDGRNMHKSPVSVGGRNGDYSHPNGTEKPPQNPPQNHRNIGGENAAVERIIIFYSDGTFRSYSMR